jgi:hypothetical protein
MKFHPSGITARMRPRKRTLALLAALVLLIWSAVLYRTYRYPFFWDDYHCIRQYSAQELLSTFHGWDDPDKIETPALRPIVAVLFAFQGFAFGENVILHRIFLTALMWTFLFVLGLLLAQLQFNTFQIGLVFALFVFSRVFASVNLWIILSSLVLCYVLMVLTIILFILWVNQGRFLHFSLMALCALLAVFTREEAYLLPAASLLIWALLPDHRRFWRRALIAALCLLAITAIHVLFRLIFVPEAPSPRFSTDALQTLWLCVKSSWLPGGYNTIGFVDGLFANLWIGFLVLLFILFVRMARPIKLLQTAGACCLGFLLCSPAIAVAHPYGLTLPTLAFITAISIAVMEVCRQTQSIVRADKRRQCALVSFLALGLIIGITGGLRRSMYVAEFLHQNCAPRMLFDAKFVFDLYERPPTVPERRKAAARSRFAAAGIVTIQDIQSLYRNCVEYDPEYVQNRQTQTAPFLPKYEYGSYASY